MLQNRERVRGPDPAARDASSTDQTYYELLGVDQQSDHATIAEAYWRGAGKCKGDPSAVNLLAELNEAYEVLTSRARGEYDALLGREPVTDGSSSADSTPRRRRSLAAVCRRWRPHLIVLGPLSGIVAARKAGKAVFASTLPPETEETPPSPVTEQPLLAPEHEQHHDAVLATDSELSNAERVRSSTAAIVARWRSTQPEAGEWKGLDRL